MGRRTLKMPPRTYEQQIEEYQIFMKEKEEKWQNQQTTEENSHTTEQEKQTSSGEQNTGNTGKVVEEGSRKKGGVNPPPETPKPDFTPPPQAVKKQSSEKMEEAVERARLRDFTVIQAKRDNCDKLIKEALRGLDFASIHNYMIETNWQIAIDGYLTIPSIADLVKIAENLLETVCFDEDVEMASTAGFLAYKQEDEETLSLNILFYCSSSEAYLEKD
jgi:hypothetical protein